MQENLHSETPIDYRHGLTGIGSTFEYLVQKGNFDADPDVILFLFSRVLFQRILFNFVVTITLFSLNLNHSGA